MPRLIPKVIVAALTLLLLSNSSAALDFSPKNGVVIYENPSDHDIVKVYSSKFSKDFVINFLKNNGFVIRDVKICKENGRTVIKVYTSAGKKLDVFSRIIEKDVLLKLSKLGTLYVSFDKGVTVKGNVQIVCHEDLRDIYKVTGYSDIMYSVDKLSILKMVALTSSFAPAAFLISRFYARRIFNSDVDVKEKLYRIRSFSVFFPVILAVALIYIMIYADFMLIYDFIVSYFLKYNDFIFISGFVLTWIFVYIVISFALILGCFPYYRRLKQEDISPKKTLKHTTLLILMMVVPVLMWITLMSGITKFVKPNTEITCLIFALFMLGLMIISPNILTLFQRARKLEGELREKIIKFCRDNGVKISDVKVIEGLPEKVANAAVSGVLHKYVFLTDYLVESMSENEILAIVAHEIGHIKGKHNLISGAYAVIFFTLLIYSSKFVKLPNLSLYEFIALFLAVMLLFFLLLGRLMIYLENKADKFAANVIGKDVYISVLNKLAELNIMKRRTGKFFNIFTLHPSIEARIKMLKRGK